MAEETQDDVRVEKRSLLGRLAVPTVVGILSAAIGVAVPVFVPSLLGLQKVVTADQMTPPIFVHPFGEVVVNLNEGRMNRYLRLDITLMVDGDKKAEKAFGVEMEQKKSILTNWLLGFLADMSMDDVRGAAGQNRLRREIQNAFNANLYPDGDDRILDVLFEEFSIQ